MNKTEINIWGRDFELNIVYQNYPGEEITELQDETVTKLKEVDFDLAKEETRKYIYKYFADELGNDNLDNIFRFVMPRSILILRADEDRLFAVMCDFKLDMEHGIAIVYKNEEYAAAGPKDLIL